MLKWTYCYQQKENNLKESTRTCPNCGKELVSSARKCKYCNAKIKVQVSDLKPKKIIEFKLFLLVSSIFLLLPFGVLLFNTGLTSNSYRQMLKDGIIFLIIFVTYIFYIISLLKKEYSKHFERKNSCDGK